MFRLVITILRDRFGVGANSASSTSTTSTTSTSTSTVDFSGFAAPVAVLEDTLARVEQFAEQQITSKAQTGTDTRQVAPRRAELLGHLRSIAGVAKTLKSEVPGIGVLKAPAAKARAATLVNEAQTFATNAQIYASVLIEHGQPSDFVAQLNAATAAYKDAVALRGSSLAAQKASTAGIKSGIATGRQIVNQLDANLKQLLRKSPEDLAAWKAARRVPRSVGGGTASVAPATTATPAVHTTAQSSGAA